MNIEITLQITIRVTHIHTSTHVSQLRGCWVDYYADYYILIRDGHSACYVNKMILIFFDRRVNRTRILTQHSDTQIDADMYAKYQVL